MKDPINLDRFQLRLITLSAVLISLVAVLLLVSGCSPTNTVEPSQEAVETTSVEVVEPTVAPEPAEDAVPSEWIAALTKAQMYVDTMPFSEQGLYEQLTSEYGEKFSPEAARYALNLVEADWNAEALEAALVYQNDMAMSPDAIHEQLVHPNGNQFTNEQADYAIANLP